jgi:CRP-like cAMP-binding protein
MNSSISNNLKEYLNSITEIKDETWKEIEGLFSEITIAKGDYFVRNGEVALKIGFLKSGVLRAFYTNRHGKEYNKHFFLQNSLVGAYSSLISGKENRIAQQALTDCTIIVADYKKLTELYNLYPDFERFSRKYAELSFVQKENRELEIVLLDADKRYSIFRKQFPNLDQIIPQYHIASYLGISPTQLSRIRKTLSEK